MDTIVATSGNGRKIQDLFNAIDGLITGGKFSPSTVWERIYTVYGGVGNVASDQLTQVIYKGVGDGSDKIYFGMRMVLDDDTTSVWGTIEFNGYAGFDPDLNSWEDQPGAITKFLVNTTLPSFPCTHNTAFSYWITATTKRVIVTVKMATQYMTGYFGFFTPVAVEKQYPYPLLLAGTTYKKDISWDGNVSSATDPIAENYNAGGSYNTIIPAVTNASVITSMRYRKVDGTWGAGYNSSGTDRNNVSKFGELCVFPTNTRSTELYTVYHAPGAEITRDSHVLIPFLLYSNYPCNLLGKLDGIYWIGAAKDIASEDIVVINDKNYIVFNNILDRGGNSYFVVEWE